MSEKSKNILLGVLIVGLVAMTVAYAALSTNLAINGTATVENTKWDIRFENYAVGTGNNVDAPTVAAALSGADASVTQLSNVDVTLSKPGDKLVYQFDIVNNGTIDARKASFEMSITPQGGTAETATSYGTLTTGPVDYTISCPNEPAVLTRLTGAAHSHTCTLTVEYKSLDNTSTVTGRQASQTAGEDQTATIAGGTYTISARWNYTQN